MDGERRLFMPFYLLILGGVTVAAIIIEAVLILFALDERIEKVADIGLWVVAGFLATFCVVGILTIANILPK